MNRIGTTLAALGLCVAAAACQSPQQKIAAKEDMMTAAGFKFVPANTPPEVIARLREAARKVAVDPAVLGTIGKAGSPIEYLDAPAFQAYWDADARIMVQAVKGIGKVE